MSAFTAAELAALMEGMTEQQKLLFMQQYSAERKDRTIALILSILFGGFGVDRFYVGDILLERVRKVSSHALRRPRRVNRRTIN